MTRTVLDASCSSRSPSCRRCISSRSSRSARSPRNASAHRGRSICTPRTRRASGSSETCMTEHSNGSSRSPSGCTWPRISPAPEATPERRSKPPRRISRPRSTSSASSPTATYPSVLGHLGLARAIGSIAAGSDLPITLDELPTERLDAGVEATAFFVVAEALTNARKHSAASEIHVRARVNRGWLRVEVLDDGVGGADVRPSAGLSGLRDRVEQAGGRFDVVSSPGHGTRVTASIPLGPLDGGLFSDGVSATPPSVPAPRHISRSQLVFWGAVAPDRDRRSDRAAARRDVSPLEQHDSAGLRRPGRDVGRRKAARARHPPHRPERRRALARVVSRPPRHRHVHRPVVPRLLPARGAASERGRAQLPGRLASRDRRGQRQRPRQRASVSLAGRCEVEARSGVALGGRDANRS